MRSRVAVLCVLLAGCGRIGFDPAGEDVGIEVISSVTADTVEVFVGMTDCKNCQVTGPSGFRTSGDGTFHDATGVSSAPMVGGRARITVPVGALNVLIVATEGGTVVGAGITDGSEQVVTLDAIVDPNLSSVWGTGVARCATADFVGHTGPNRVIAIDELDWDCDGFGNSSNVECSVETYRATRAATPFEANCVLNATVNGTSACVLGGPMCTDGSGPGFGCMAVGATSCVLDDFCGACTGQSVFDCVMANGNPYVQCDIPLLPDGTVCPGMAEVDLVPLNPGATCSFINIAKGTLIRIDSGNSLVLDQLRIDVAARPACKAEIDPQGMILTPTFNEVALLDVKGQTGKHLYVPLHLVASPVASCTGPTICTLTVSPDGIGACMQ